MLNLDDKEYDLNTLFSFEVLKEILLKLARNQINLEEKIQNIVNLYQNKESSEKDDSLNIFETEKDFILSQKDFSSLNDKERDKEKEEENNNDEIIEKKEITFKENTSQNNNPIKKEIESELKEKNNEKKENEDNAENKHNKNIKEDIDNKKDKEYKENENKIENKDEIENKDNNNNKESKKEDENELKKEEINNNNNTGFMADFAKKMYKIIKQNKSKISSLEDEVKSMSKKLNLYESNNKDNKSDLEEINKKIKQLTKKLSEHDDKIETCEDKCKDFDILTAFKDSGDGKIDATKVMVKSLEEKILKKIEVVETKNKGGSYLNEKMELVLSKIEKDRQNIEKLFNLTGDNKESIDEVKKELSHKSKEAGKNGEYLKNLNKKIKEAKDTLNQRIDEFNGVIQNINKDIDALKKSADNHASETQIFKLGLNENQIDKEAIKDINIKINDLRKKVNDMENSLKLYLEKNQIDELDAQIKNMKLILDKKISKEDLKELYNLHLSDVDEINDTNNKILSVYDQVKKHNVDIQGILKKIDNINTNIGLMQTYLNNNSNQTTNQPIIDFSKFIDNQKLTDTIKPLIKEMEKMFQEVYSLRRELNDMDNLNKEFIKQSNLDKLEEKINEKILDLKNSSQKRYLDKVEHYKAIKNLEALIKVQVEENRKDADSWLMAKQPLKCFNCATCESNIKNVTPPNDYLAWNKYPPGDRIYRMGQGFSHMLQMMTNEFIKNIERNSNENNQNNNEQSYKSLNINNIENNSNSEKTLLGLSVNNKQQIFDEMNLNLRKSGKIRLPVMSKYIKQKKINNYANDAPVSDDERDREKEYDDMFNKLRIVGSPKILKIMKKKTGLNMYGPIEASDKSINTESNLNHNFSDIKKNLTKSHNFKS